MNKREKERFKMFIKEEWKNIFTYLPFFTLIFLGLFFTFKYVEFLPGNVFGVFWFLSLIVTVLLTWSYLYKVSDKRSNFKDIRNKLRFAFKDLTESPEYFETLLFGMEPTYDPLIKSGVLKSIVEERFKKHQDILIEYLKQHPDCISSVIEGLLECAGFESNIPKRNKCVFFIQNVLSETKEYLSTDYHTVILRNISMKNKPETLELAIGLYKSVATSEFLGELLFEASGIYGFEEDDCYDVVDVLIDNGANVNWSHPATSATVLHIFMARDGLFSNGCGVRKILEAGADLLIADNDGLYPYAYGARFGRIGALNVLAEYDPRVTELVLNIAINEARQFFEFAESYPEDGISPSQGYGDFWMQLKGAEASFAT